jgi:hypothetical protein
MMELIHSTCSVWPATKIFKLACNANCCVSRKEKRKKINCLPGVFVAQSRRAFACPDDAVLAFSTGRNINVTGDYLWRQNRRAESGKFRLSDRSRFLT